MSEVENWHVVPLPLVAGETAPKGVKINLNAHPRQWMQLQTVDGEPIASTGKLLNTDTFYGIYFEEIHHVAQTESGGAYLNPGSSGHKLGIYTLILAPIMDNKSAIFALSDLSQRFIISIFDRIDLGGGLIGTSEAFAVCGVPVHWVKNGLYCVVRFRIEGWSGQATPFKVDATKYVPGTVAAKGFDYTGQSDSKKGIGKSTDEIVKKALKIKWE